jgi:protein MpaA
VLGRPIYVTELGDRRSARRLLVVGCIHGDEAAGIAVARAVERAPARGEDVWVVDDLNPDGRASHTRQNAHRVDLNRNFPAGWRPLGVPGDQQYSGPAPLSEPEARIARSLVTRLRPAVAVWFHQPLGVVDQSGGDRGVELRFARLLGLPLRRLPRYPGSAVGWENHVVPRGTAFVVELPAGHLPRSRALRYARAISQRFPRVR